VIEVRYPISVVRIHFLRFHLVRSSIVPAFLLAERDRVSKSSTVLGIELESCSIAEITFRYKHS